MVCGEYLLKICLIGSAVTEKTSIIRRFAEGKFETNYLPTLGVDITTKVIEVDSNKIKLILVDTAGQEFFGKLRPSYYRGASACLIFTKMCDLTSLKATSDWLAEFRKHMPDPSIPITLLAVIPGYFVDVRKHTRIYRKSSWPREIIQYLLRKINKSEEKKKNKDVNLYLRSSFTELNNIKFFWKEGENMAKKLGLNYFEAAPTDSIAFEECICSLVRQALSKTA